MASAFWTLEDGRGFARRWSWMSNMLLRITDELKTIEGAEAFYDYLEKFVYRDENGDEYNGYGGFNRGAESIMLNFDLRTFTPENREFFWKATQMALSKLKISPDPQNEDAIALLIDLLDMNKRIRKGEDPMLLNHMSSVAPQPPEKLGPGWSTSSG